MSNQPNRFPKPKVTIKQWLIFVAVLAVFNYLAVLVVQTLTPNRFSAEQYYLRVAVVFLFMNGLVFGYGFFLLILSWWSGIYRHKRGLPDPPLRTVGWQVANGLCVTPCFSLCVTLTTATLISIQLYRIGLAGAGAALCLAALTCLSLGLFVWAAKKMIGRINEVTQAVDDPLHPASSPPNTVNRYSSRL